MPLFPPVTDTLRWSDLVEQGRSQLPLVAPDWTDQNPSDPGIAVLELLAWLVEVDSYRSSAISDRERRLLLSLTGFRPGAPRAARALLRLRSAAQLVPAGLVAMGDRAHEDVPLTLLEDVVVRGVEVAAIAWASAEAEADAYRTRCTDLTRDHSTGRPVQPLGADPAVGDCLLVGLSGAASLAAGPLDLWLVAAPGSAAPEHPSSGALHHSARTTWEAWDGTDWRAIVPADVDDRTAALTRSGRVRLDLPATPAALLGDQSSGALAGRSLAWLRCRLASGRHDAPPSLASVHVDTGEAIASAPYSAELVTPPDATITGTPGPGAQLLSSSLALVTTFDGTVTSVGFDAPGGAAGPPAVDIVTWVPPAGALPGRLVVGAAVLGVATGVPDESFRLDRPWCGEPPRLWVTVPGGTAIPIRVVDDLALAGALEHAAVLDPDGVTVRVGDGRCGATLPPGGTVLVAGTWTTPIGLGDLRPPLAVRVPSDARTTALLGADAGSTEAAMVGGIAPGAPAEDVPATAARAEAALWVHDRLTELADRHRATSLDDLHLDVVRRSGTPERAVTALDVERLALATPGTSLWRARALPGVDPRLPGLAADGCVTVAIVPWLPVDRPTPTPELLARVRAQLDLGRTLGTRVFVVGPDYVTVGVRATLQLLPGARADRVVPAATAAIEAFLHPVTGGPSGRGWPFGRPVRRSEVLQLLDELPGIDRAEGLVLVRERADGPSETCGDLAICPTDLVLAGSVQLSATDEGSR